MTFHKHEKLRICLTIFVMAFIFLQSALPGDMSGTESNAIVRLIAALTGLDQEPLRLIVRKAAHFTEFTILGICLMQNAKDRACRFERSFPDLKISGCVWLIGTIYAITDEFHQLFVPGRACAFGDVCIDSAGVLAGIAVTTFLAKNRS